MKFPLKYLLIYSQLGLVLPVGIVQKDIPMICDRCKGFKAKDRSVPCTVLEGHPCAPCKERERIRRKIGQLEEELTNLKAQYKTLASATNTIHDPFIHKFPPEIASHIFRLSLPVLNFGEHGPRATNQLSGRTQWAVPLRLGAVSRKWRQLAWETPDLWQTVFIHIHPSTSHFLAQSLPGLLREWLERSAVLPLTILFHDFRYSDQTNLDDAWTEDEFSDDSTSDMSEFPTNQILEILNFDSDRWRNLHISAGPHIFGRFSCSIQPPQLVDLDLTLNLSLSQDPIPKFLIGSELNPTHLKLTGFPLTSINVHWDNITHATLCKTRIEECIDFLRRASSLEYCHICTPSEVHDSMIDFGKPIIQPRLRSLNLATSYATSILEAIHLPSLEEWTQDMGGLRIPTAVMLSLLERSGCFLKVLNLENVPLPSQDLDALLQALSSLEVLRLCFKWGFLDISIMNDIITRIFCAAPGCNLSVEAAIPDYLLPRLQSIEIMPFAPYLWDQLPQLYRQGQRKTLKLKSAAFKSHITDETASQLLQLLDEGVDLQILDETVGGDFLENFKIRIHERSF